MSVFIVKNLVINLVNVSIVIRKENTVRKNRPSTW